MASYHDWELFLFDARGKVDRGELKPDPEWQRGYIWNIKDEQLLIDSILKGIPIPKFYLTEEWNPKKGVGVHFAVDGQQRLKAIYRFLSNKFSIEIQGKPYYFRDLDTKTQAKITKYKLNGHYMTDFTQEDITLLFKRLNSTGLKLTNMEAWNNEYYGKNVLKMIREIYEEICDFPYKRDYRDYDEKDLEKLKSSYEATIYTEENIKRMLPLDDIIDLCNCLHKNAVESGSKSELDSYLKKNKDISNNESSELKSKFRKTAKNMREILTKQDIESSLYGKRTHFITLFLAIGLTIREYYILGDVINLKNDLLNFINNQPDEYKESVLGAIRQKAARDKRVTFLKKIILKYAKKLDTHRFFDESLKFKFWNKPDHTCGICHKKINNFKDAVLDHIEPWAKGGRTEEANAQLAHKKCNQKKRDKEEEFVILT
jgi:hypothetical protein